MELALCLVKHGIRVTFVNTEFDHKRVIKSLSEESNVPDMMQLMSIPDGLESWDDRKDLGKLTINFPGHAWEAGDFNREDKSI